MSGPQAFADILAFIARDFSVRIHRHYCLQLILALDGRFSCVTDGTPVKGRQDLLINQNVTHVCEVQQGGVLVCFIEPQSAVGRALRGNLSKGSWGGLDQALTEPARSALLAALREAHDAQTKRSALADLLAALVAQGGTARPPAPDARIARLLGWIDAHLEQRLTLDQAALVAGLSAERTRHLFTLQVGTPYSQYLRWRRTFQAVRLVLQQGQSLTQASLAAGFADQAHFCNTFSRTFGCSAKGLLRNSRNIQFLNPLID